MELSHSQLATLRHMLGIDKPDEARPEPYRNYYCANPGDEELAALEAAGAVERYSTQGGYWWYRTTSAGRAAAITSHRTIRLPKAKRIYARFLDVKDAISDLTFRDFLTSPQYAEIRRAA